MKKFVCSPPLPLAFALLVFAIFSARPLQADAVKTTAAPSVAHGCPVAQADTAGAGRALCALIKTGSLAEMSSPGFVDQRSAVEAFYRPTGYALAWTTASGHPTEQALALITALENADKMGLLPADYDGSRWEARLAHLRNTASPSAAELARLDLALTVSAMRY